MKTPSVSIGLPVRNGEDYLRIAIESLLAQDYRDFELIIADNASDDGTPQICHEYARRDSRIRFHRSDTNVGAAQNFNRVFGLSRGKYFMWAAHDDRWHPSYVRRCVAGLDQNEKVVLCASAVRFVDRFGVALHDAALRNVIIEYNRLHTHSMTLVERVRELTKTLNWYAIYGLIRADALRQTKLIRDAYGADVILLMELLFHGETMILADPLFDYRLFDQRQIMKTLALQYEGVAVTPSLLAKLKPYTELAKNLLAVVEESSIPPSIKTILREDLLENVSFANHLWANKIRVENQPLLQNRDRYLASVQIRDLFARAPTRAPEQLRELADRKYQDFLSGLSVLDRVRYRTPRFVAGVQRLLDRHFLWRFRSKP